MDCNHYQQQISFFIDGELPPGSEADIFTHLGSCEQCRTFLKNVISLRNTITLAPRTTVPFLLDRRINAQFQSAGKQISFRHLAQNFINTRYSFRTIGLTALLSALFGILSTSLLNKTDRSDQTIVCLTPLPEVEVNGYIVTPQTYTKGVKQ